MLISGWFYGANLSLSKENHALAKENIALKTKVAALSKPYKRGSKKARLKSADSGDVFVLTPFESAKLHLGRAEDALGRKDYSTAVHELDLADQEADKALGQVSRASDEARKSITDRLSDLQKRLSGGK